MFPIFLTFQNTPTTPAYLFVLPLVGKNQDRLDVSLCPHLFANYLAYNEFSGAYKRSKDVSYL